MKFCGFTVLPTPQERRKQQRRFRDAQLIQREMSQLERQYDELEEVGRDIEQALRDAGEDSKLGLDKLIHVHVGLCLHGTVILEIFIGILIFVGGGFYEN